MITEEDKDFVYVSGWLKSDYPELYNELIEILNRNNVAHGLLNNTKDYWCRDYMPVQWGENQFAQYQYSPDYLKNKQQFKTDTEKVTSSLYHMEINKCPLIIDGGNMVACEETSSTNGQPKSYIIMTDKVMEENPQYTQPDIESLIKESLGSKQIEIVWLPWKHSDLCGHTDGIVRFVGCNDHGKPIVMTHLSLYGKKHAEQMRSILQDHFEVNELTISEKNNLSWAYINCLQTKDLIIIPGTGNPTTDKEAYEQIKKLYPQYADKIFQIQMKSLISTGGGALNCCTWTIKTSFTNEND